MEVGLAFGVVIGVATLTRAVGFVLIVIPIAMWWDALPRRVIWRQAAAMVGVVLVFVVPWTIRNAVAMHGFVPIATDSAPTLWAGHNPNAYGGPMAPPSSLLSSIHAPRGDPRSTSSPSTASFSAKHSPGWRTPSTSFA